MSFESLRRFRPAVFLVGDDIGIPLFVRVLRTMAVVVLAWIASVFAYPLINRLGGGSFVAEEPRLAAFSEAAESLRSQLFPEAEDRLPKLVLAGEEAVEPAVRYRRRATIEHAGTARTFTLLEVRHARPRALFPTVDEVVTPVTIHPLLEAVQTAAATRQEIAAGEPPAPVDEALARRYAQELQRLYTQHLGTDVGWSPAFIRRLNGPIQFISVWLFFTAALIIAARFICHILPDRRVRQIESFDGDSTATKTPWHREGGDSAELLESYSAAIRAFEDNTSCAGARVQSPFLELRRHAIAAFAVAQNISQIPSFLEAKASSLSDRQYASLAMTRYLIWAIPTVGFVGTVVGIGDSLERTAALQSPEPLTVAIAKGAVSTSIGVAFDTTFVALVLSLLAMLLYNLIQGLEEMNVVSRKDEVLDHLTHLENARPFRCQAAGIAIGVDQLASITDRLVEQIQRLPEIPLAAGLSEPFSAGRGFPVYWGLAAGLLILLTIVAIGLGWIPLPA